MKKMLLPALGVLIGFALVATATYAWFSASVTPKNVKNQVVSTGTLELTYTDGTEIKLEKARPGATATKTITVKNTGTLDTSYNLVWQVLKNEITNNEMVMSATCQRLDKNGEVEENCEGLDETPITGNMVLKGRDIPSGYSHRYTVTVTFKEINAEQNYNQGKNFTGVLGIDEYKEITPVYCTYDGTPNNRTSYEKGIYTYSYATSTSSWAVQLTSVDSTDPITEVPCTYINDEPITLMMNMFTMSNATSIDVSNFNTSNVTSMGSMFSYTKATEIKGLDKLDTSNVTDMSGMFSSSKISSLDLSNFDTSKVTNMIAMFSSTAASEIKGLNNFNTSNVIYMERMFSDTINLSSLDLRGFNTSNVITLNRMFSYSGVTTLDLSSFDTSNVEYLDETFAYCDNLETIYVSDKFKTDKYIPDGNDSKNNIIFEGSTKLKGSAGTTYDKNNVGKEYAKVDGGTSSPGYFTLKTN